MKFSNGNEPTVHLLQSLGVCMYLTCPDARTLLSPLNIAMICVRMCVCVLCVCVCVCGNSVCANVHATSCF